RSKQSMLPATSRSATIVRATLPSTERIRSFQCVVRGARPRERVVASQSCRPLLSAGGLHITDLLLARQDKEEGPRGDDCSEEVRDQVDPDVAPLEQAGHHRAERDRGVEGAA